MTPNPDPTEVNRLYRSKAGDSFNARFNPLLFKRILENQKGSISNQELDDFKIEENPDVLEKYIKIYWQREDNKSFKIEGKVIEDIYHEMEKWKERNEKEIDELKVHYVNVTFKKVFLPDEFEAFMAGRVECDYCHITKEKIDVLINKHQLNKKKYTRGWSLEIDRKEPNLEYTKKNCVWCCYWCNNAKTDEFSYKEFKKIGSVIETIWKDRLKSKS